MDRLDLRTALDEVTPPDKLVRTAGTSDRPTQSQLAARRAAKPLPALKTSFDDTQLLVKSPRLPLGPPTSSPKIKASRPSPVPTPPSEVPSLKSSKSSKSSLFSLFSKPNVERARGYNEAGLQPPPIPSSHGFGPKNKKVVDPRGRDSEKSSRAPSLRAPSRAASQPPVSTRPPKKRQDPDKTPKQQPKPRHGKGICWEPPTLSHALPEAMKRANLLDADSCLNLANRRKLKKARNGNGKDKPALSRPGSSHQNSALRRQESIAESLNSVSEEMQGEIKRRVYILHASSRLLEYCGDGLPQRKPQRVIDIGSKSAAFASDSIPGHPYVLRVVEDTTCGGDPDALTPKKSIFSKMLVPSRRKACRGLLLVCDSPGEMNGWMCAVRREIDRAKSKSPRPQTATKRYSSESMRVRQAVKTPDTLAIPKSPFFTSSAGSTTPTTSVGMGSPGYRFPDHLSATTADDESSEVSPVHSTRPVIQSKSLPDIQRQIRFDDEAPAPEMRGISPASTTTSDDSPVSPSSSTGRQHDTAGTSLEATPLSDFGKYSDESPFTQPSEHQKFFTPMSTPLVDTFPGKSDSHPKCQDDPSSSNDSKLNRSSSRYKLYPTIVKHSYKLSTSPSGPPNSPMPPPTPALPKHLDISPPGDASASSSKTKEPPEDAYPPQPLRSAPESPGDSTPTTNQDERPYLSQITPDSPKSPGPVPAHLIGNAFAQRLPASTTTVRNLSTDHLPTPPSPVRTQHSISAPQQNPSTLQPHPGQQWPPRRTSLRSPSPIPLKVSTSTISKSINPLRSSPTNRNTFSLHHNLEPLPESKSAPVGLRISDTRTSFFPTSDARAGALQALFGGIDTPTDALPRPAEPSTPVSAPAPSAPTPLQSKRSSGQLRRPPSIHVNSDPAPFLAPSKAKRASAAANDATAAAATADPSSRLLSTRVPVVRPASVRPSARTRRSTPSLPPLAPPPDVPLPPCPPVVSVGLGRGVEA